MAKKCPDKKRYKTKLDADIDLASIQASRSRQRKKSFAQDPPTRSYRCGICSGWHLTGQEKRGAESESLTSPHPGR